MAKIIKNVDSVSHTYCGQEIAVDGEYEIQYFEIEAWANNSNLIVDIANGIVVVNNGTSDITDTNSAIIFLKDQLPIETHIIEQPPFAQPTYRTKRNATTDLITIQVGESENVDFVLTEERYVSGGFVLVENSQFGDYATAQIIDINGTIPEAYRSTLCENWPTVATYIEKEWIIPCMSGGIAKHEINTYPLNAKITAGLCLRITYYATNSGNDRRVAVNYYLTKKI